MQTAGLSSPAPNPEMLNMIRNPAPQPGQGAQTAQGSQQAQTAQPSGDAAQQPAQTQGQPSAGQTAAQQPAAAPQPTAGQAAQTGELPPMPDIPIPELPPEAIDMAELTAAGGLRRQDGNFQAFLQKLADTPDFTQTMNQLLEGFQPANAEGEVPAELESLLNLLPKDKPELTNLVRQQVSGGTRFTGGLFSLLRDAYPQTASKAAKSDMLQFLRRYSDYTSAPHIERSLVRTLGQLAKAVPRETGETVEQFAGQLGERLETGDRAGALRLLQGKILPFLNDFRDSHPDMRLPNTLLSIFQPLAARYENCGEEGLLQAMRQLAEHTVFKPHLGGRSAGELLQMVKQDGDARTAEETRFADQLAETADWAMRGKGGGEPRRIIRQLLSNVLLNRSVYLPLNHAVLPMEWDGRQLVSELWVDPDAEKQARGQDAHERLIRFLLQMDVPGLGRFDLVLSNQGESVDLQLACPEQVVPFTALLQREIGYILEENGLKLTGMQVQEFEKPLTLTKVFPKLGKGENTGVNMKV